MGCDIHLMVERRVDGVWQSVDNWEPDGDQSSCFYDDRSYNLFAVLAGVRNYDEVTPISGPRGIPDDVSPQVKAYIERWGIDGHSHSFLTTLDLMTFDWTQSVKRTGIMSLSEWARMKIYGEPDMSSRGITGPGIQIIPMEDFEKSWNKLYDKEDSYFLLLPRGDSKIEAELAIDLGLPAYTKIYIDGHWNKMHCDTCFNFLGRTLPRLWQLGAYAESRIVFFFDN